MSRAHESYGQARLTFTDRFGIWLSQRAIRKWLPKRNDLVVLEPGCGYHARNLVALRRQVARGVGIDFSISPEVKSIPGLEFHEGPVESALPDLVPDSFDLVLLISVLEHLDDPLDTLRMLFSALKPDGILLVNVPTWRGKIFLEFSAFRLGWSPALEMDDHKMYYNKQDLWPLLVRTGFKPSQLRLTYHKFGLNLFAVCKKGAT